MTLLECHPLKQGLPSQRSIDLTKSWNSSQRDQLEYLQRNQNRISSVLPPSMTNNAMEPDTVNLGPLSANSSVIGGHQGPQSSGQQSMSSSVRKTKTLSNCNCQLDSYDGQFLLCRYAKQWLDYIEHKTDLPVNYAQSVILYERVQRKANNLGDERQISLDIPRTFPEEPFFGNPESEGRQVLTQILNTLSKHSSSTGYLQGLNYIVASLYYHCGEVLAFELTIRLLNDYHLKEVHMSKLPGLYLHCEIIRVLV